MFPNRFKLVFITVMLFIITGTSTIFSQTYDYSHRKSKCTLKVPAGATVKASLLRNHFGFGGSIRRWAFDTLQQDSGGVTQNYGSTFLQYFDYATPENEMKWGYIQGGTEKVDPDYAKADYIQEFLDKNDIKLRGHNLFWNEKKDWIPEWTWELSKPDFKTAMQERLESAMTHFNGKVVQWDVINEIIHADKGATPAVTMLEERSGDPNIFSWILDEARKIDKTSQFVINDYSMETQDATLDAYVKKCKPLASKFDIVGIEGHYQDKVFDKSSIDSKVAKLVTGLNKKVWFTEVDWTFGIAQSPAKMEEFMRSCFANKDVDGIVIWTWCKRKMWRAELTNYFVDSLLVETPTGKKWKDVRKDWKTDTSGTANADGNFSFTGYQGKYRVVANNDTQYVYLYPKDSLQYLGKDILPVNPPSVQPAKHSSIVRLNGATINIPVGQAEHKPLYLSTYSISGKLIAKTPLSFSNGTATVAGLPSGCQVYRISSSDKTYYCGIGLQVH